ncbi:MAG: hypothetical protein JWO80_6448 [Bryobacterales bacterium]|nr:hypothetical protein [Bryobacterales bacterium]
MALWISEPLRSNWLDRYPSLADLALLTVCIVCFLHVPVSLIDDAFIAYRYAANLVNGSGLVFTAGQRVEGFSDLSWTLLMGVPMLFHIRPELFAIGVAASSATAALLVARRTAVSGLGVSHLTSLVVVGLAALNCDFWIMTTNGIESGLYSLVLVTSLALIILNRRSWSGLMLGFATTLRPEALALAPIAALCIGVSSLRRGDRGIASIKTGFTVLLPWALIVLTVLAWRHAYYGAWVPNTVMAKAHPLRTSDLTEGIAYVIRFAVRSAPWLLVSFSAALINAPAALLIGLGWLLLQIVIVLPNGGDWMPGYRLLSVCVPLMAVMSAFAIEHLFATRRLRVYGFAALLLTCCVVQAHNRRWTFSKGILNRHTRVEMVGIDENSFIQLADALKPALTPGDLVSPEVLGIFSYMLPGIPMHDWLGLADEHVAHHGTVYLPMYGKAEPSYSVEVVAPAVFLLIRGDNTVRMFQHDTAGRFWTRYDCWRVASKSEGVILAIRRDRAQEILAAIRQSALQIEPMTIAPN